MEHFTSNSKRRKSERVTDYKAESSNSCVIHDHSLFYHPIPQHLQRRVDNSGNPYFIDQRFQTTSREDPRIPLPKNWNRGYDSQGRTYFFNTETRKSTWKHPSCQCSWTFELPERQRNLSWSGYLPTLNIPAATPRPLDYTQMQAFHESGRRNQLSASSRWKLDQVNGIFEECQVLRLKLTYFQDDKYSKEYNKYKKGLNQLLLKLDWIHPEGNQEISATHRNAENIVKKSLTELEDKANAYAAK